MNIHKECKRVTILYFIEIAVKYSTNIRILDLNFHKETNNMSIINKYLYVTA